MSSSAATGKPSDLPSIVAASFGIGAYGLALGLTYPLLTELLMARGVSPHVLGLNAATMGVGIAISTVTLARITARYSAGALITAGLFAAAAVILAFGFTDSLAVWFGLRILLGFAVNTVFVLTEAWVNQAAADEIRGRAVSGFTLALSAGFAVGPLGIPLLGAATALPFAACAVLVAMIAISIGLVSRRAQTRLPSAPPGSLRQFVIAAPLLVVMVMAFGFSDWTMISMMPAYFLGKGMTPGEASATVSVIHFGMILVGVPIGMALDRLPRLKVGAACAACTAGCFALLPALAPDGWALWVVLAVLGAGSVGVYMTALTLLGQRFSGGMLVAGSAVFSMGFTIAGTVGMVGAGSTMELVGLEAVPVGFAVSFAVLTLAIMQALRRGR
jgi:MFS family permease